MRPNFTDIICTRVLCFLKEEGHGSNKDKSKAFPRVVNLFRNSFDLRFVTGSESYFTICCKQNVLQFNIVQSYTYLRR